MILFDTTIKVKRMKSSAGNARALIATATGEASVQPVAKEQAQIADGQFGTLYVAYVERTLPAMQGDVITDPNGTKYVVKQVIPRDEGPFPYTELTLTKQP